MVRQEWTRWAAKGLVMSSRGRSLSMFVVQRTFTLVRRGYDPAEVDRHLELVAGWFTSTEVGRELSRGRAQLEQRERDLERARGELEQSVRGAQLEADATLEGARKRAEAQAGEGDRALAAAREEASELLAAAGREREAILDA